MSTSSQTGPILTTKLFVPAPRLQVVPRSRLIARLDAGTTCKLTLISAPAGFGKTTLASAWVAGAPSPSPPASTEEPRRLAAWLSLDEDDGDLSRFLTYVVAALQTAAPQLGAGAVALLRSRHPPPVDSVLAALLNDIAALPAQCTLILDDYHVLEAQAVDQALTFLLDHLPPQLHLVIVTREDPPLPLARLRARGQLAELRAADLRFTPDEAATFLNQVMGLDLSASEVAALEHRTEGWIAGLQLAALSMQGRDDASGFIQAFAGDNRYIVDYLVEEVLQRQPQALRTFLLQTSILERLSGPLCDAVTCQEESAALLDLLERANLFVTPLDDRRHWYRYHALFADVLHAHLLDEQPDQIADLHRRASGWYEQNSLYAAAVHHALAADDSARVAALAEIAWPAMDAQFQSATWLRWAQLLSDEMLNARPVLSTAYAWALLNLGDLEAAEQRLRAAEFWLEGAGDADRRVGRENPRPDPAMVVVDEGQFRTLGASIATARAYLALTLGDVQRTVRHAQRALALLPAEEHIRRGIVAALLGLAYWANGELDAAYTALADGMDNMRKGGNLLFALRGTYSLADIRVVQGRLRAAIEIYEQSLALAVEEGELVQQGTSDLHIGLSQLYLEQGDTRAAAAYLRKGEELGRQDAFPHWGYRFSLAQARTKHAEGDLDGALALLDEAERLYVRTPVPDMYPVGALKARIWIVQGRWRAALDWAHAQGLSVHDDLSCVREYAHITLARALSAECAAEGRDSTCDTVAAFLESLLEAAETGGRIGSAIEILVLQALIAQAQGNLVQALNCLERALRLAEPEGYVRVFVDEGPPLARLLVAAAAQHIAPAYTAKLLAVFAAEEQQQIQCLPTIPPSEQSLIEPLSERELEVLRLIAAGLSNHEIGDRLFLALSSVKGHNRNIFAKLQVQRRTEAVARARDLGLL